MGFRLNICEIFFQKYGNPENSFICYSGIPDSYLLKEGSKEKVSEFVFVGNDRKEAPD